MSDTSFQESQPTYEEVAAENTRLRRRVAELEAGILRVMDVSSRRERDASSA
jgi:hypothetical protein